MKSTRLMFEFYRKYDGQTLHQIFKYRYNYNWTVIIFTLSFPSLTLTFNFSVGRFVYFFEFWPERLHRVEAFPICGYAFPSFPPLHLCNSLKTNRESLL